MALMQSKTMNSTLLSAYQFVLIKVMAGFFKSYGINTLIDTLNQPIKRGPKTTVFLYFIAESPQEDSLNSSQTKAQDLFFYQVKFHYAPPQQKFYGSQPSYEVINLMPHTERLQTEARHILLVQYQLKSHYTAHAPAKKIYLRATLYDK
jgi:cellulose biosynthesis protein BcsQ